jgi:hypothetical protein
MAINWKTAATVAIGVAVIAGCRFLRVTVPPELVALLAGTLSGAMPKLFGGPS